MRARENTGDLSRVVTIPNALSLARIILIGPYLGLLFGRNDRVIATVVLAIAGTTDFADGFLARRLDQVTTLGKVLDPTADRLLLGAAITSMIAYGAVSPLLAGVVIGREALVAGAVLVLAARGAPRIDVSRIGKAATFGLLVSFPLLLLGHGTGGWTRGIVVTAWVVLIPSLVLSIAAAINYVPMVRRGLEEQRANLVADSRFGEFNEPSR